MRRLSGPETIAFVAWTFRNRAANCRETESIAHQAPLYERIADDVEKIVPELPEEETVASWAQKVAGWGAKRVRVRAEGYAAREVGTALENSPYPDDIEHGTDRLHWESGWKKRDREIRWVVTEVTLDELKAAWSERRPTAPPPDNEDGLAWDGAGYPFVARDGGLLWLALAKPDPDDGMLMVRQGDLSPEAIGRAWGVVRAMVGVAL